MDEQNLGLGETSKVVKEMWKRLDSQAKMVRILW